MSFAKASILIASVMASMGIEAGCGSAPPRNSEAGALDVIDERPAGTIDTLEEAQSLVDQWLAVNKATGGVQRGATRTPSGLWLFSFQRAGTLVVGGTHFMLRVHEDGDVEYLGGL